MFTLFVAALALVAVAMVCCLLVLAWGCMGMAIEWCTDRCRALRSDRVRAEADAA